MKAQWKVKSGIATAIMGFVPVIGTEVVMLNDHFITAVIFQKAQCCTWGWLRALIRDASRAHDDAQAFG